MDINKKKTAAVMVLLVAVSLIGFYSLLVEFPVIGLGQFLFQGTYVPSFDDMPDIETNKVQVSTTSYHDCATGGTPTTVEDIFNLNKKASFVELKLWGVVSNGEIYCNNQPASSYVADVFCLDSGYDVLIGSIEINSASLPKEIKPPEHPYAHPTTMPYKEKVFEFVDACKIIKVRATINTEYRQGNWLYVHALTLPHTYSSFLDEKDIKGIPVKMSCPSQYDYCSYVTEGCDKLIIKNTGNRYDCNSEGCFGVYGSYEITVECDIPTSPLGGSTVKLHGRSYTQICNNNGICDSGETCDNCADCTCSPGTLCCNGECVQVCTNDYDCDDGKAWTIDRCAGSGSCGAVCQHTPDPNYCGQCQDLNPDTGECTQRYCIGYDGNQYSPGQSETRECGKCGAQTRSCNPTTCQWDTFGSCTGEGECYGGTTRACTVDGIPGQQVCSNQCYWDQCMQTGDCIPQSKRCNGNTLEICSGEGTWQYSKTCQYGCDNLAAVCFACVPNQYRCEGSTRQICSGNGMSWEFVEQCMKGCEDGLCHVCTPGTYRCNGDAKQVCDDGFNWLTMETCTYGCDNGMCLACMPRVQRCSGNYLETCADNGMAWLSNYCQYGCNAMDKECNTLCNPGEKRCFNENLQRCIDDGMSWETLQTCPYGCRDNACYSPFCGDNPVPYRYDPNYCNEDAGETSENCPYDCGYSALSLRAIINQHYITGENIFINIEVEGTTKPVIVYGKILSGVQTIHPQVSSSSINGVASLKFLVTRSGMFTLSIWAEHPDSHQVITAETSISFSSPLFLSMQFDDIQYLNEEIEAVLRVRDATGIPVEISSIAADIKVNNQPIVCVPDSDCWEEIAAGEYRIHTLVPVTVGEGTAVFTVTAGKGGYETATKTISFLISKPKINIKFADGEPGTFGIQRETQTVKVFTTSPQGALIDVDEINMKVTKPDKSIEMVTLAHVSTGTYVVGFTFTQLELYSFEVTARKGGYSTSTTETTTAVGTSGDITNFISMWALLPVAIFLLIGLGIYKWFKGRKKG